MPRYFDPKVWRPIPGFETYVCDQDGRVANRETGTTLYLNYLFRYQSKRTGETLGTKGYTLVRKDDHGNRKNIKLSMQACIRRAWPDLPTDHIVIDGVVYRQCYRGNDWYYISKNGVLINHRYNNRRIRITYRKDGSASARVTLHGVQETIDVDMLVEHVWFESEE